MPKIILKFGDTVLKEVPLEKPETTLGRKLDNDVVIDNLAVSSHHARIVQENRTFFIEDMGSTNGTFLNETKIEKRRLQHGDHIRVGKHVLVFEAEPASAASPTPAAPAPDPDRTVMMPPQQQHDLLKGKPAEKGGDALPGGKVGVLLVMSGQTDKNEYRLTSRISVIGTQDTAAVRLTGWFAPKVAALISRHDTGYSISMAEDAKQILVNGAVIQGRCDLKDGDLIEVAGTKMYFYLRQ